MATLLTNDGLEVKVSQLFVNQSPTVKEMVGNLGGEDVPVPVQIDKDTLDVFLVYFEKHQNDPEKDKEAADKTDEDRKAEKEMKEWDGKWADFKTSANLVDMVKYVKYVKAACFLGHKKLVKLIGKQMVILGRGKTPEEIRDMIGVCQTCRKAKCTNEMQKEVVKVVATANNEERKEVENVRCLECENCKETTCQHGKLLIAYTEDEEKKIRTIKPYEQWKKEMEVRQEAEKKKQSSQTNGSCQTNGSESSSSTTVGAN